MTTEHCKTVDSYSIKHEKRIINKTIKVQVNAEENNEKHISHVEVINTSKNINLQINIIRVSAYDEPLEDLQRKSYTKGCITFLQLDSSTTLIVLYIK